jgi:hypothetical protein
MVVEPPTPTYLKWSKVPISFSRTDQWTSFSNPGRYLLVLDLVVARTRLTQVLIDGESGLNVIFSSTLKKMGNDYTSLLKPTDAPYYDIVPGTTTMPLGNLLFLSRLAPLKTTGPSTSSSR